MSGPKVQERALDRMVALLQSEPMPAVGWDDIEHKLMDRIAESRPLAQSIPQPVDSARWVRPLPHHNQARGRPSDTLARGAQLTAMAAAIALAIGAGARSSPPASGSATTARWLDASSIAWLPGSSSDAPGGDRDLAALRPGDGIDAMSAPISLARPNAVRLTLAAGSRAIVKASGSSDVVVLERGSIRAEVTPRDPADGFVEAFAVEVGQTRVAAHGTTFSVDRRAEGVVVEVEHGTVAIGPVGHDGITTGHLLIGPKRALFSLDGARSARLLPPVEQPPALAQAAHSVDREPSVEPSSGAARVLSAEPAKISAVAAREPSLHAPDLPQADASQALQAVSAPSLQAPAVPAPGAVPPPPRILTEAAALADVRRCFGKIYGGTSPSVRVSVTATLTLTAQPNGHLSAARFQPPLEGAFQSCVWAAVKDGRLANDAPVMVIPFALGL